jgi:hypothetical protein
VMACWSSLRENAAARVRIEDKFGVIERYDKWVTDRDDKGVEDRDGKEVTDRKQD